MTYWDIDPQDIDPDTGRPYSNYSSPSLDTSFHDHEMDVDDEPDEPDETLQALRAAERALLGAYGEPVEGASMQSEKGVDAICRVRAEIAKREHPGETSARAAGYTRAIVADSSHHTLNLLVKPDADLDGTFPAFCRDENEMLTVNGWLFTIVTDVED
jgi:hypothetical protein